MKKSAIFTDYLPDSLMLEIFSRVNNTVDRNSISLACKRFYNLDNEQRKRLRVGCGLNPATEALTTLCHRFPNLNEIEVTYSGWMSELGKQLEDPDLSILPNICPFLTDLTLSHFTFITDAGLSSLASCSKLSSLKLNFIPGIKGSGLLPVVSGCKKLKRIHLVSCSNISDRWWIECLGRQETLQDLCIQNCRGIGEGGLYRLLGTWRNIKRFQFELDPTYRYNVVMEQLLACKWRFMWFPSENMVELSLTNCMIGMEEGLATHSKNLRAVSIRVPSDSPLPLLTDNSVRVTDNSLKSLARNCTRLESVSLSFSDGGFQSLSSFSLDGILSLMTLCPVKNLFLDGVYCFNDSGLEALCSSEHLQTLELIRCQEISDEGLEFVARYPCLRVLRLAKCLGVTDDGLKPLIGSCKLELLAVNDCPRVSSSGVQGAAESVSYS